MNELKLFSHLTVTVYFKMKCREGEISRTRGQNFTSAYCEFVSLPISAVILSEDSRPGMKFGGVLMKCSASGTSYEEQI